MMRLSIRAHSKPDCFLCGSPGETLHVGLKDRLFGVAGEWNLKQCRNGACGLGWLDPMPEEQDFAKLYEDYFTHEMAISFAADQTSLFRKELGAALLAGGFGYTLQQSRLGTSLFRLLGRHSRFFRARVGSGIAWLDASWRGRLLDVGCGNGEFMLRMRKLGWDVVGFEPDPRAAAVARETHDLRVVSSSLSAEDFTAASFDAITMNNVIEHVTDPLATLGLLKKLLKAGGRLVVQTPNLSSLGHRRFGGEWRGLEPPRHLFLFTPQALTTMMGSAGFKIVAAENNAIAADFMWNQSAPRPSMVNSFLFMMIEHFLTGWPLYRNWGEQLAIIATKA